MGLIVIVAAHVADKKLENYAFQQQLTLFFKIHCAKKKKPAQLFIFCLWNCKFYML